MSRKLIQYLSIGIMVLAATGQWSCGKSEEANSSPSATANISSEIAVRVRVAVPQEWISTVSISGDLHSRSTVDIKPEVGGRLIAVYFQEGDLVRKGQLLAELDPGNYKLAYDQASATLSVAEAGLERAKVSAEHVATEKIRADNLLSNGGITQKDHQATVTGVKEADTQVRLAEAQRAQARAALAIAEKALKDCNIFAPAPGNVQKRFFDNGSLLSPGVSLYTLVDNSQLELESVVPSYQLASIRLGQNAVFKTPTWGELTFKGAVSAINPTVELDNRSVKVILKIANPGGELRSGMYARGEITTGIKVKALVISRDSLIPEKEGEDMAGVYVVREGKAHRLRIQIGDSHQDQVWVRQGLEEGDRVITEIGPSIKEGAAVKILP